MFPNWSNIVSGLMALYSVFRRARIRAIALILVTGMYVFFGYGAVVMDGVADLFSGIMGAMLYLADGRQTLKVECDRVSAVMTSGVGFLRFWVSFLFGDIMWKLFSVYVASWNMLITLKLVMVCAKTVWFGGSA